MIALQVCDQGGASSTTLLHFLARSETLLTVLIHAGFAELSAPHASFTALGSECHTLILHVANTMIALQFCDQGGASSATLLHAGRILFLLCVIYVLRPPERKSSMHFDL